MGISEVNSPINRKGSQVGSTLPLSPGARSSPSRASADSVPEEKGSTTHHPDQDPDIEEQEGAPVRIQGEETHVHMIGPGEEQGLEERGDAYGFMRRLADRIMGRRQRTVSNYRFDNFPK